MSKGADIMNNSANMQRLLRKDMRIEELLEEIKQLKDSNDRLRKWLEQSHEAYEKLDTLAVSEMIK